MILRPKYSASTKGRTYTWSKWRRSTRPALGSRTKYHPGYPFPKCKERFLVFDRPNKTTWVRCPLRHRARCPTQRRPSSWRFHHGLFSNLGAAFRWLTKRASLVRFYMRQALRSFNVGSILSSRSIIDVEFRFAPPYLLRHLAFWRRILSHSPGLSDLRLIPEDPFNAVNPLMPNLTFSSRPLLFRAPAHG